MRALIEVTVFVLVGIAALLYIVKNVHSLRKQLHQRKMERFVQELSEAMDEMSSSAQLSASFQWENIGKLVVRDKRIDEEYDIAEVRDVFYHYVVNSIMIHGMAEQEQRFKGLGEIEMDAGISIARDAARQTLQQVGFDVNAIDQSIGLNS